MKPSREQIEDWALEVGAMLDVQEAISNAPDMTVFSDGKLAAFVDLAYAAGRKAGMEEAQQCCRDMRAQFDAEAGLLQASGASYCIEAIDAAMEADQ